VLPLSDVMFVDAPVSGSKGPAEAGQLLILASGPPAAEATMRNSSQWSRNRSGSKPVEDTLKFCLTAGGLITRSVSEGPPVTVTYELTERGRALMPALDLIAAWARDNLPPGDC
jgi:HxlR-like helix-turn-helix/NAD binding domain of 6-phosphogluconate dehydrogenase